MGNIFDTGATWLADQLKTHASTEVVYQRGSDQVAVKATIGKTEFEVDDGSGIIQRVQSRDYLIQTADLLFGGVLTLPVAGDRIRETMGSQTFVYEVMAPGKEPHYRFRDLRPDVLVKGPECRGKSMPGADLVRGWGGHVVCPDWPVEHSTTDLIQRIRRGDDLQPWPRVQTLTIDGVKVEPSPRFSLTWVSAPDGPRPVLYSNGRRVTAPWSIQLVHDQPKDSFGSSA